jgi:hypothetical protein
MAGFGLKLYHGMILFPLFSNPFGMMRARLTFWKSLSSNEVEKIGHVGLVQHFVILVVPMSELLFSPSKWFNTIYNAVAQRK